MGSTEKKRVNYVIDKNWDDKWMLCISTQIEHDTPEQAMEALRAMYRLENLELVEVTVDVRGNEAVDLFLNNGGANHGN